MQHKNPPLRYSPPDYLWKKCGFKKSSNLMVRLDCKDIGQDPEMRKPLSIWFRQHLKKLKSSFWFKMGRDND